MIASRFPSDSFSTLSSGNSGSGGGAMTAGAGGGTAAGFGAWTGFGMAVLARFGVAALGGGGAATAAGGGGGGAAAAGDGAGGGGGGAAAAGGGAGGGGGAAAAGGGGIVAFTAAWQPGESFAKLFCRHSSASLLPGEVLMQLAMKSERQFARIALFCASVSWACATPKVSTSPAIAVTIDAAACNFRSRIALMSCIPRFRRP